MSADTSITRSKRRERIELRFSEDELTAIDAKAAERGLRRSPWIGALVRAHLGCQVKPPRDVENALVDAWRQLKRIAIHLNQAVQELNMATMDKGQPDLAKEVVRIALFRDSVAVQMAAIGRALDGDASYWRGNV